MYSLLLLIIATAGLFAQAQYEASRDLPNHPNVKIVRGLINKYQIQNDTAFKWFGPNQEDTKPMRNLKCI
ncbi:MAG: hypothetical protein IPF72_03075 [Chitinophagaceae bacterium]|nr:hypothetical protein [Chitinophagaceae bacterium]